MRIGPYQVLGEVARGGAGVVFRARDGELGREVALKLLQSDRGDGRARARFLQEGAALARLRHPHLLGIHDLGEHAGRPYLVLPLVAGLSLAGRLEREGPLPVAEAVDLCARVADALAHAHAAGVLHRDVKPANILVSAGAGPLLVDFGLAKDLLAAEGSLTRTGEQLGTPGYWSPEQAAGDRAAIGPATDVYSLGATLHALLVGEPPFVEDGLMEHVAATLRRPPPRPSAGRPEVGAALDAVVLTCLAKAPAERYASAQDLRDDLLRVLRGEAVLARPPRPATSAPARALVVALVVVALAGAALAARGGAGRDAAAGAAAKPALEAPGLATGALEEALALRARGDRAGARRALDALCASPAPAPEASLESADLWLDLGDAQRAAADLARLRDPAPPRAVPLAVEVALLGGRTAEAAARAERAVLDAPDDPWALCARAQVAFAEADPARAVRDLERAAAHGVALALELQAEGLLACGRAEAALAAAERALASRPSVRAAAARARALSASGRGAEGLAAAEALLRAGGEAPRAWLARGEVRYAAGRGQDAGDDARRALELAPGSVAALTLRARARWSARRFDEALDDLQRALALAPGRLDVRLERAALLVSEARHLEAIADHDAILAARPGWGQVWGLRAYARLGQGDHAGAIEDLTRQLELEPGNAMAWEHRGLVRAAGGDLEGALFDAGRALELEPTEARSATRDALRERLAGGRAAAPPAAPGPRITRIELAPE